MCFSKSSARRKVGPRGFTLIELFVSQAIVGIMAAAVFALIAAQTKSFHSNWSTSEAQIRLRESTHVILRDLQGIGSDEDKPGQLIGFIDGGAAASDAVVVFRQDSSLCTGAAAVSSVDDEDEELTLALIDHDGNGATAPVCPLGNIVGCTSASVTGRVVHIRGDSRAGFFRVSNASDSSCTLTVDTPDNGPFLANYRSQNDVSVSDMEDVLDSGSSSGLGNITTALMGSSISFSIDDGREVLQRSINGLPPTDVIDNVRDLQVQLGYDLDADGELSAGEWKTGNVLAGADPGNFRAARIGLMTFAGSKDAIFSKAPTTFGNRNHSAAPGGRRYRYSFVVAAARNR